MEEFTVKLSRPAGATKTRTVSLSGELTIQNALPLKKGLLKAFKGANEVTLDLEKITGLDLSCLQLLCSAHRTAIFEEKKFSIAGNSPVLFNQILADAGFSLHAGCADDCEKSCIWSGGNE